MCFRSPSITASEPLVHKKLGPGDSQTSQYAWPIDVDALKDLKSSVITPQHDMITPRCSGIWVDLPPGKSPHTLYPFGIHDELGDPWDYAVTKGVLVLWAKHCITNPPPGCEHCRNCTVLATSSNLQGILQQMERGVHENTPLVYYSVRSLVILLRKQGEIKVLQLRKLNDAQKLAGKAVAINNFKSWVMAVGSRRVECIDQLVHVDLARKGGIQNLIDLYDCVAQQVYHPQNYTEEDELRGLLLWWLGGAQIAGIAHCALNLPFLHTIQSQTIVPHLVASPSMPTTSEVVTLVFDALASFHFFFKVERVILSRVQDQVITYISKY